AEITTLRCGQVSFGRTTLIRLHGKGRKDRTVPIWPQTSRVLRRWFQVLEADDANLAFPSMKGTALSPDGLDYILQRAVKQAAVACPSLLNKRVTPHALRRTTAMHLLQAGVDIAVIALWLGHESIGADEAASIVAKTIQNHGFSCRLETVNAIEAWRGRLPGDGYRTVRRVVLHTLNLAALLPITSVWAGLRENPSALMPPNSPSLLYAATTGATPFRFNLHVSDLGHSLIIGPPGAGKSTLLGLLTAQWFRYPGAQVFAFDKGYSLYVLTRAANGEFYDIGGERTHVAFCPLREIDSDQDLAWAVEWLEGLCVAQGAAITPKERNAIAEAVVQLRLSPTRTLTEFCAEVQDATVRDALQFYTLGGPLGQLLDAEEDVLGSGRLVTFETETLMNLGDKAVIAVLLYLF